MKSLHLILVMLIFVSCQSNSETTDAKSHFDQEIANRMELLTTIVIAGDSLKPKIQLIHQEVANLILLSKDIENLGASVMRANSFFDALAAEFRINLTDFTKLTPSMHVDEIELNVKQNELNLFNQIIFKNTNLKNTMYTAQ